jgi:hypothetical protein
MLVRIADHQAYAWQRRDLFRRTLRIATGDNDPGVRILTTNPPDGRTRILVRSRSYGAGIHYYDGSLCGSGGAGKAAFFELTFEGGAIRLGGAAAEVFYKESRHTLW